MFSPWIRLILIAAGLLVGVRELEDGQVIGWFAIGAALLLVYGHVRYGTVHWTLQAVRLGAGADVIRRRLAHTMFPRLLNAQNRAYYAWLRGGVALQEGKESEAREALSTAFRGRLRTPRDRALVALTLARLDQETGHVEESRRWIEEAANGLPEDEFRAALAELNLE